MPSDFERAVAIRTSARFTISFYILLNIGFYCGKVRFIELWQSGKSTKTIKSRIMVRCADFITCFILYSAIKIKHKLKITA